MSVDDKITLVDKESSKLTDESEDSSHSSSSSSTMVVGRCLELPAALASPCCLVCCAAAVDSGMVCARAAVVEFVDLSTHGG